MEHMRPPLRGKVIQQGEVMKNDDRRLIQIACLCLFVFASFSIIPLAHADKVIPYEKGYGQTGTYSSPRRWVQPTAQGIQGQPNNKVIPFGWRGRVKVGKAVLGRLNAIGMTVTALEFASYMYTGGGSNMELNIDNFTVQSVLKATDYTCSEENCFQCYIDGTTPRHSLGDAVQDCITRTATCNAWQDTTMRFGGASFDPETKNFILGYDCITIYEVPIVSGMLRVFPINSQAEFYNNGFFEIRSNALPVDEPIWEPDPKLTGAVLDEYPQVFKDEVSSNAGIISRPWYYKTTDTNGNIKEDKQFDLVRDPQTQPLPESPTVPDPTGIPDGKKIPNPDKNPLNSPKAEPNPAQKPQAEPPPAIATENALAGTTTINNTYNITNNEAQEVPEFSNEEVEYQANEEEIPVPPPLTAPEAEQSLSVLKVPTIVSAESVFDFILPHASNFEAKPILSTNSAACPPPRTLSVIGGTKISMPFDTICTFLEMIKKMILPALGFFMALAWIKRISAA